MDKETQKRINALTKFVALRECLVSSFEAMKNLQDKYSFKPGATASNSRYVSNMQYALNDLKISIKDFEDWAKHE